MTISTDPSKIVSIITRTVDQIGDGAAEEIERVAAQLEADAKDKADALRRFASSMREKTRSASADIAAFSSKANDIFTSIGALEARVAKDIPLENLKRLAATAPNGQSCDTSAVDPD